MASFQFLLKQTLIPILIISTLTLTTQGCYTHIISFGDSLADTGNLFATTQYDNPTPNYASPPYGTTYFHRPTGRFCDGRLIIDFMAQSLGLPLVRPYKSGAGAGKFREGVNFATAGATALDPKFLEARGIYNGFTNDSLGVQLGWFKDMLPSLCTQTFSNCRELFQSSLVIVGEIGGNDYCLPLFGGRSKAEAASFVPLVVKAIGSAVNELIKLGAVRLMVPGNLPMGCSVGYLKYFNTSNEKEYDPATGCLVWLNEIMEHHNELLKKEMEWIQQLYPHTTIMYADYYNAGLRLYQSSAQYGFTEGGMKACCGGGGLYTTDTNVACGDSPTATCDNPSLYINWDSAHFTEAANRWITKFLLEESYTTPPFNTSCLVNPISTAKYSNHDSL